MTCLMKLTLAARLVADTSQSNQLYIIKRIILKLAKLMFVAATEAILYLSVVPWCPEILLGYFLVFSCKWFVFEVN